VAGEVVHHERKDEGVAQAYGVAPLPAPASALAHGDVRLVLDVRVERVVRARAVDVLVAVAELEAAAAPRLDVHQPEGAAALVEAAAQLVAHDPEVAPDRLIEGLPQPHRVRLRDEPSR